MLHLLDESLEAFLRATVPLPRREIDVSFEAPDSDWAARVSRPTVNLYLWDVRRNLEQRDGGVEEVTEADGRVRRRPPLPRINVRYLITAWTAEMRDEHALLGSALAALLLHAELGPDHLQGVYADVRPVPTMDIAAGDGTDNSDFWSALGGQLKPGLDLVVTATVDAALMITAGSPVERYAIRTSLARTRAGERHLVAGRAAEPAGTVVVTPRGSGRVRGDGAFLVPGEPGDEVSVDGAVRGVIPEEGAIDLTGAGEQ
jgi:hypothetical protein